MMNHPEYLVNEYTDEEFILVTDELDTPEKAMAWLKDYTGADYEEIEIDEAERWLAPDPERPDEWYKPTHVNDPNGAAYWKTLV